MSPTTPSRRVFIGTSAFAAAQSLWGRWLRAATAAKNDRPARAKSVILIFNCGAPSHIDLWDMKPNAPVDIRGPFRPISTNVSGIHVSELLPRMAQRADKLAIVRTLHHTHGGHNSGMYWSIVGRPYPIDSTLINPSRSDIPSFGTLVGWLAQRDNYSGSVPPYVITPAPHCDSFKYITPGQMGSCLGARFDPFVFNSDPKADSSAAHSLRLAAGIDHQRLLDRVSLLSELHERGVSVQAESVTDVDINRAKALSMLASVDASQAFDLSLEPANVRDRYGRHSWGQSHLLARRLIEAGAKFVTCVNGPSITWDTHLDNFNQLKNRLVPPMEQAFAALLDDLTERGMLDETLIVWMGDFGRTPVINKDAGRDHWPQCYSMVLAGGGIRGGQVVGESDAKGSSPRLRPVSPADIHATVFSALGYDHQMTYLSADGRPIPLSDGEPIRELFV